MLPDISLPVHQMGFNKERFALPIMLALPVLSPTGLLGSLVFGTLVRIVRFAFLSLALGFHQQIPSQ
jgi:hypothetical protein